VSIVSPSWATFILLTLPRRPILTYERQGCNKRGVKPLKHGIIYQVGKTPRLLPGEPNLGFAPVRAILREKTEQLAKESRVNYAKLQTVEHNFRVCFIGKVDADDFRNIVRPAVDICWSRKRRAASPIGSRLGITDGSASIAAESPDVVQDDYRDEVSLRDPDLMGQEQTTVAGTYDAAVGNAGWELGQLGIPRVRRHV